MENHHLWPRCFGGLIIDHWNRVLLTAEEHRATHHLLVKIFPSNKKLVFAAARMSKDGLGRKINLTKLAIGIIYRRETKQGKCA